MKHAQPDIRVSHGFVTDACLPDALVPETKVQDGFPYNSAADCHPVYALPTLVRAVLSSVVWMRAWPKLVALAGTASI